MAVRRTVFDRRRREVPTTDLEERVEAAFNAVSATYLPVPVVQRAPVGIETEAQLGSLVLAEGTCTVRLPAPRLQDAGQVIVVARDAASGTVTVVPTTGLVSGGASTTITTGQARSFFCSGSDWH